MFRFSQEMWKGLTGRGLYHACDSQCLNYSQPCKGKCMPGTHEILQINIDINKKLIYYKKLTLGYIIYSLNFSI